MTLSMPSRGFFSTCLRVNPKISTTKGEAQLEFGGIQAGIPTWPLPLSPTWAEGKHVTLIHGHRQATWGPQLPWAPQERGSQTHTMARAFSSTIRSGNYTTQQS